MEFELISEIVKETVKKFINIDDQINLSQFFEGKKINLKDYTIKAKQNQQQKNQSLNVSSGSQNIQSVNSSVNQGSYVSKQEDNKKKKSVETWESQEGQQILQKALQNLNLDLNKIQKVKFSSISDSQLLEEKKIVKNQLKKYDQAFQNYFGKLPEKSNKELLRPLYIYYNMIKQQIDKNVESKQENVKKKQDNVNLNQNILLNNPKIDKQRLQFTLDDLKLKKTKLRQILQEYQTEFIKNNNRKIKFNKDLIPIEKEYQKYKEIKQEIQRIEAQL